MNITRETEKDAVKSFPRTSTRRKKTGENSRMGHDILTNTLVITKVEILSRALEDQGTAKKGKITNTYSGIQKRFIPQIPRMPGNETGMARILLEIERGYHILFDHFTEALFLVTEVAIDCNEQACRLLACEYEDILYHPLDRFLPVLQPEGRRSLEILQERTLDALAITPQRFSLQVRRVDGRLLDAEMTINAYPVRGEPVLLVMVRDITRQRKEENERRAAYDELKKAHEELMELNTAKDSFLCSLSHELRTPLTSILSFSEILLQHDDVDPKTRIEFLQTIKSECERLARLVEDVLPDSGMEIREKVWRDEPIQIEEVIREVALIHQKLLEEKRLGLHLDTKPDLPPVFVDRDKIQQVLMNLITNAIKFSYNRSTIRVQAALLEEKQPVKGSKWIITSVCDQGIGINPKDIKLIFNKFYRARQDTPANQTRGSGLGLSICREIVIHYGGKIWLESREGKGSTFSFTLPV